MFTADWQVLDQETGQKSLSLEPELTTILARSRDPATLRYYWEQWREQSGKKIRNMYHKYVGLYNQAAKANGFVDASLMKVSAYESDTFQQEMEDTWQVVHYTCVLFSTVLLVGAAAALPTAARLRPHQGTVLNMDQEPNICSKFWSQGREL